MAQKQDFSLPFNDLTKYIPQNLQNPVNVGLVDNLFNRFMTRDESIPFYGYVGRKPASSDDRSPRIPQANPDRDINAVVPVLNFKLGSETYTFTVQDLLNKARAVGITDPTLNWLYSQGNNYLPPINIDRFANYYNYYWVAKALPSKPVLSWNPDLEPEYYTIARPQDSDLDKDNVVVATTEPIVLTGSGFEDQTFTVAFTSSVGVTPSTPNGTGPADGFTVTASASLGAYTTFGPNATGANQYSFTLTSSEQVVYFNVKKGTTIVTLVSFKIVRDPIYDTNGDYVADESFVAGDTFTIDTTFLSHTYNVVFTGGAGVKGKIRDIQALSTYQVIDGVQLSEGQRVLVKNNSSVENGIYVVSAQSWSRASDYAGATMVAGARVWVTSGVVNAGLLFTSGPGNSWPAGVPSLNNTNDWQEGNFWVHGSELEAMNLTRTQVIQAVRPIIEYSNKLQLNAFVNDGVPSDAGVVAYKQQKSEFNQLPMFDLYRYDGTHAGLVSSIFYYEEDPTADIDVVLQKRVKLSNNQSADYIFNHGLSDSNGNLLFFKSGSELKTIWHPGYSVPTIVDQTFVGDGNGTLTSLTLTEASQQQVWTLSAITPTTFSVVGSKIKELPTAVATITVGTPYSNEYFSCLITAGSTPFSIGDAFVFRVGNRETPRYVYRAEDQTIVDLYGGQAADTTGIGAYQTPRQLVNNPYNESREEVAEGTLYSHLRSILFNQVPGTPIDYSFGGSIKSWSEQVTLLASLLMQRDLTPISIIDHAQTQYANGLNAIADIFKQTAVQYIATNGVVSYDGSVEQEDRLNAMLDAILEARKLDTDVRTVLFDTTSGVIGIPATLPQLGIVEAIQPYFTFDNVIAQNVLIHHDGHSSRPYIDDMTFRRALLNNSADITVLRSDGSATPAVGSFTTTEPARPYKGELWIRPNGTESLMLAFDVDFDTPPPFGQPVGTTWYDRDAGAAGILRVWDGSDWIAQPSHSIAWKVINLAETLNQLMLRVERRLYANINQTARKVDFSGLLSDPAFTDHLKHELFNYAAANNLNPLGSDYTPADAFTWNYSAANIADLAPLTTATVPARWVDILLAHQQTVPGVIPTDAPNLEPWKLLGFSAYSTWWASLSPAQQASYTPFARPSELSNGTFIDAGYVRAAKSSGGLTPLSGLQTIDGIALSSGDRVLLTAEPSPVNNGIWTVSAGLWSRAPIALTAKTYVRVTEGVENRSTVWTLTASVANVNIDPVNFTQVRNWTDALWADIQAARPTLRLSVNTRLDDLLPPYVSPTTAQAVNALTTVVPTGLTANYLFGENGPVETFWKRTIDYRYGLARALFRHDPLQFLGFCWGFNWVEVDGILYDGFDLNIPGHKRFRLHGEPIQAIERDSTALTIGAASGTDPVSVDLIYDAYEVAGGSRYQTFSVRSNGQIIGYIREGQPAATISTSAITLTNIRIEDAGRPFRIGDKFTITSEADGSNLTVAFTPATTYIYLGFGQIFTNALRSAAIDTSDSYAIDAFRGWDVNLGHRAGGLVATDDLKVSTENDQLSTASYSLLVKKNGLVKDLWVHGLRVTVSQFGSSVPATGGQAPATDGSDWVFSIEGYNPRYTKISYYNLDTAGDYETFNILTQTTTDTVWKHYTTTTARVDALLPLTITGIQNVINFLFGYQAYLEEQGIEFNKDPASNVDAETGRARTWQLEVEKFVNACYLGLQAGQGHIVNSFMDQLWVRQDTGLLAEFMDHSLFDVTAHSGIFDVLGTRFKAADLFVVRGNQRSQFGAVAPMYSAHIQLDEYEHLFIFNRFIEESTQTGTLYDPFSGSGVVTYKFNGRRQAIQTFRPEFGGHYLVGNEVRQNLQASTDNVANFYDTNAVFRNDLTTRHSLSLLGFNTKQYFDDLDISSKSQFNFWRGLVQSKGTNASIGAYLNNQRFADAKIDEYWAYKIAEYGDARQHTYPELKLSVNDSLQQFTQLQFDAGTGDELPNFIQINRFDESRWFSIDDLDHDAYFKAEPVGTFVLTTAIVDQLYTLPFVADLLVGQNFEKVNATTIKAKGTTVAITGYGPATPRYNPVKLFNYVDKELVSEIPLWHPAMGQHTPTALESINIISKQNPAKYNYSTRVVNNNSYDPLRPWGSNEVGRIWLDTTNLSYIPYYDEMIFADRTERLSRWGALADFATIDVYEWVQSTVPPAEYNALAQVQAGNADLDPSQKAAGEVAREELYSRDRVWSIRPIAWSRAGTPAEGAHPAFNGSYEQRLFVDADGLLSMESGLFKDFGITAGMRVGAWDPTPAKERPLSESIITDQFTKKLLHAGVDFTTPIVANLDAVVGGCSVNASVYGYTDVVGRLIFSAPAPAPIPRSDANGTVVGNDYFVELTVQLEDGSAETVLLDQLFDPAPTAGLPTVELLAGQILTYDFASIGIRISVTVTAGGTYTGSAVQQAIATALASEVIVRDAVRTTEIVPLSAGLAASLTAITNNPDDVEYGQNIAAYHGHTPGPVCRVATTSNVILSGLQTIDGVVLNNGDKVLVCDQTNDAENGIYVAHPGSWTQLGITVGEFVRVDEGATKGRKYFLRTSSGCEEIQAPGWRAWSIPTQEQLDADGRQPNSSWKPYYGDFTTITATEEQIKEAVAEKDKPLLLKDGTAITRYSTSWSNWEILSNTVLSATQVESGPLTITHSEKIDSARTSVYVNGISQLAAAFTISGAEVTVASVSAGSTVTAIIRHYEPTVSELTFNPDVEDDLSFQRQYKKDYEYVSLPVRNDEGAITSTLYYFWVKNKTTAAAGKKLSVQSIVQELRDGPTNYLTFQHLIGTGTTADPYRYDAITISGLSYVVAKDDTFKLRFTRNFTLRDDPQELDLKDTHTEWTLIRQNQRTRIPEALWKKLTDSVCGQDTAGNPVPALRRSLYDERNGTRTQFGFGPEQTLAPKDLLISSITYTIVNTKLINTNVPASSTGEYPPDFIEFLDFNQSDAWFATPEAARQTMTNIWTTAKPSQINEIFFAALNDILANNFELTDIFKTSRLSAYSIKVVATAPAQPVYE